jgi:nucleotide-binding universal stress UspA family protein
MQSILVAVDGSELSRKALGMAIDLAVQYDAKLSIVHVHLHGRPVDELSKMAEVEHMVSHASTNLQLGAGRPIPSTIAGVLEHALDATEVITGIGDFILASARDDANEAGLENVPTYSRDGDYADGILDTADESGADLIVMGQRGLGRFRQMILGSVSNKVVQNANCNVLIVK